MENIMQAMMNNPEIAQLMQQPGMMEKLQGLQSNPMEAMNDPDLMRLMTALQNSGAMNEMMNAAQSGGFDPSSFGNSGGFGGGGSPMGNGYGTRPAAAASPTSPKVNNPHGGKVHEITSSSQFQTLLTQGTQLVVPVIVDFTAAWCGPCKVFAPKFAEMAQTYGPNAILLKVDGDKNRDLVETYHISAYPTIMTFVDGKATNTIQGADMSSIQRAISSAMSECEMKREAKSLARFQHFPIRENECVFYRTVAWDKLQQKLSSVLVDGCDQQFYQGYSTPGQLLTDSIALCTFLQDYKKNSMTALNPSQIKALDALLSWPEQHYATPLHILRIALFHGDAAREFANNGLCKGNASNVLVRVCQHVQNTDVNMVAVLILRAMTSAFEKRSIARVALQSCDSLLEVITVFMLTFGDDQHVTSSAMSLLLNLSYMIYDMSTSMDVLSAVNSIVPCLLDTLPLANPDEQTLYKMLVCVGTILLAKTSSPVTEILQQANAKDSLDEWKSSYPDNVKLQEIISEISTLL